MEIGDNFASLLEKIKQLKVSDKTRERLANELNMVRNNVFKYLHVEEPVPSDDKKEENGKKEEKKEEHTSVNHPKYYCSHPSGVECIEITRHYNFAIGNAIKYLWRAGLKKEQGMSAIEKEIEDCKKAIWYINDHIKHLEKSEFLVNGEKPNGKTF